MTYIVRGLKTHTQTHKHNTDRRGREGGEQEGENRRTREERAKERGHKGGKERKGEEEVHCTERAAFSSARADQGLYCIAGSIFTRGFALRKRTLWASSSQHSSH